VRVGEADRDAWRKEHLPTVILVFVRAVRDPALAWDLAAETMAAAARSWDTSSGGSRLEWVLDLGRRVLVDAADAGRVPSLERTRNNAAAGHALTAAEQAQLRTLAEAPLLLDGPAREALARLERESPPPQILAEIALSPLTRRREAAVEERRRDV